ncbi:CPBP family intramembrane glutamic endopeptidase [Gordonia sp. CPCC 205333]|uniref:CPBP family intramembrane glutamic endopeptidase n=1 Tax=Gordonia sp. CPCC 205333 TaxID=3140790 RepID=UPI003AF3947E
MEIPQTRGFVIRYVVLAFSWSWLWWISAIVVSEHFGDETLPALFGVLGDIGPFVAVILALVAHRVGARKIAMILRSAIRLPRQKLALLGFSGIVLLIVALAAVVQQGTNEEVSAAPSLWLVVPYLLLMLIIGGGQEEVGWRGVLQPWLVSRLGRWSGSVIAGIAWFAWHLPLFWTPGSVQTHIPILAFAGFAVGFSLLVWKAMEMSSYRPSTAIALHALNNCAGIFCVFYSTQTSSSQPGSWALAAGYLVAGAIALAIPATEELTTENHGSRTESRT